MGNFYTNITVKCPDQDGVRRILENESRMGYVSPSVNDHVVVYDALAEMQDQRMLGGLARNLSFALGCPALAVLNHDDDVLAYWLYVRGKLVDEYDSCPGALNGEGNMQPRGGNAEVLCEAFGAEVQLERVQEVLHGSGGAGERFVFAVDRHLALAQALGLPACSVGFGYTYIQAGELPDDFDEEDLIEVP